MDEASKSGLWNSLKRIIDALLGTAQNRIELLAVELHEEKCRLAEIIVWTAAVAACGFMALTMVTFTIVFLFWEQGRLFVLIALSVLYVAATAFTWHRLQLRLKGPSAFSGTIGEIKKDRECLKTDN